MYTTLFRFVTSPFAREPALAVALGLSLMVGLGALLLRLNDLAFGDPQGSSAAAKASFLPIGVHLALVFAAGIWLPAALVDWFRHVAAVLS